MSALPGDPALVAEGVNAQLVVAASIEAATAQLRRLAVDSDSLAVDAVRDHVEATARLLEAVHERQLAGAGALDGYSIALRDAHVRAEAADQDRAAAQSELVGALQRDDLGRERLDRLRAVPTTPYGVLEATEATVLEAHWQVQRLEQAIAAAEAEHRRALDDMNAAAERAMAAIDAAMLASGDGDADRIGGVARGIEDALAAVWGTFVEGVGVVVDAVLAAIELGGRALVGLASGILALVQLRPLVGAPGLLGGILASPVGTLLLASAVLAVAHLVFALMVRAAADGRRPDPEVEALRMADANDRERDAAADLRSIVAVDGLDDLVRVGEYLDRLGGDREGQADDKTVVDIARMGENPPHWIVTLPSTQDWQAAGMLVGEWSGLDDAGAVNDMDANVALLLVPQVRTQVERGVLEAMRMAGIGADDPVMLVGFSQGGILAAHIAASPSREFNVTRVLAVGAPIDGIDIPTESASGAPLHVLSIQHTGDPIAALDLREPPEGLGQRRTIAVPASDAAGVPVLGPPAHDIGLYALTLAQLAERDGTLGDEFGAFIGPVASRRQFEFSE